MVSKKLFLIIMLVFFYGILGDKFISKAEQKSNSPVFPEVKFAVISDLHYYDNSLGTTGAEFQEYLVNDRKLLVESEALLDQYVEALAKEEIKFLLVSGDLTKDGEKVNHQKVQAKLEKLVDRGIQVLVVPGNHDLINGDAYAYQGDNKTRVATINDQEFAKLYAKFGYQQAIARDSESLSYVVEPVSGLWVLALDSCMWKQNDPEKASITEGEFSSTTLIWIEEVLKKAQQEQKAVIAMMHHGILEHYRSNQKYFGEYLVNDYEKVGKLFSKYKLNYVFTGHFHSQDVVTKRYTKDDFIFDLETGSPTTYPSPYRVIKITKAQEMQIQSKFIKQLPGISDYQAFARKFVSDGTKLMVKKKLKKYKVNTKDQERIAEMFAKAYLLHLAGDERPTEKVLSYQGLSFWGRIVLFMQKSLLEGWSKDLTPKDNDLIIDLSTGKVH